MHIYRERLKEEKKKKANSLLRYANACYAFFTFLCHTFHYTNMCHVCYDKIVEKFVLIYETTFTSIIRIIFVNNCCKETYNCKKICLA